MAEPTVHMKNFGGVNFNWDEVKSAEVKKGKDGNETYFIEFKTGVTAEYPLQNSGNMSSREYTLWQSLDHDTHTEITCVEDAVIKGSKKDDLITATYSKNLTVDVSSDNNDDEVIISPENDKDKSTVILDKKDKAVFYEKKLGTKLYEINHSGKYNLNNETFKNL